MFDRLSRRTSSYDLSVLSEPTRVVVETLAAAHGGRLDIVQTSMAEVMMAHGTEIALEFALWCELSGLPLSTVDLGRFTTMISSGVDDVNP